MNPLKLTFTANEQALTKTDNFTDFASNTVSYIEATFTLGENWTGYDSVRAVWKTDYYTISTVLDANFTCVVPTEVLRYKAKVFVNLVGSIVENDALTDRLTTFPVLALTVKANAAVNGSETAPVTPSQFEQFVETVRDAAESISDYSYDSEAWAVGKRGGVDVPSTDETYHNNSKYWAEQNAGLADDVADLADDVADLKEELNHTEDVLGEPNDYRTTNLIVLSDLIQGKYFDNHGDLYDVDSTYWVTPFIGIGYVDELYMNKFSTSNKQICCYDENQVYIDYCSQGHNVTDTTDYRILNLPENTRYVRASIRTVWKDSTVLAKYFWPGSPLTAGTYVTKAPETVAGKVSSMAIPNKLLKYVAFGDSLTAGRVSDDWTYRPEQAYPTVFGGIYNYTVENYAVGGQGLLSTEYAEVGYDTVNSHITDVANADLITLRWGNNDVSYPIGDVSTSGTIIYELNRIITLIRTNNSHAQIVVLSPGNMTTQGDATTDYWYNSAQAYYSLYDFNDFVSAYCKSKGILYLDVNGWMPISQMSSLLGDGVHPALSTLDVCSSYIARCIGETLNIMQNSDGIKDIKNTIQKEIPLGTFTDNTFIVRSTGNQSNNTTTWCSSGFVPVFPNAEIFFRNCHNRVNCAICQYDSNKVFISALSPADSKLVNLKVTTAPNAAYIRVTGRKSPWVLPTAYYTNYALVGGGISEEVETLTPIIDGTGIISANGKTITASTAISHTDYIAVEPQTMVTIAKMYPTALSGVFLYDSSKNIVGRIRTLAYESTVASFSIVIPDGVYYIRYNVTTANSSSTSVIKKRNYSNSQTEDFSRNLYGIAGIYKPLARLNANHAPMISIIDDDTASMYQIQRFHDICALKGVRGTFAVITKNLTNVTGLKAKLLEYEEEGFQMVTHCQDQQSYLRATTSADKALTYTNMVTAQREMAEAGFVNFDYWVSPYGVHSDWHKMLAKNLGFKCLVSLTQLMYEGYTPYEDRWFIPRMELYPTDSEGNQTLQDIKDQIDQCVASNGWLLVATHLYQWPDEDVATGYTRIKEMIQYALDAGMQFVTLAEGFETWKPVYDLHDMLG